MVTRKDLQEKLLSEGGEFVNTAGSDDEMLEKLVERGKIEDGKNAIMVEEKAGLSEESALEYYLKHKDEGIRICTGFALNYSEDGFNDWVYHAWCEDGKGNIYECTPVERAKYYGMELDDKEAEKFRRSVDFAYDAECKKREAEQRENNISYNAPTQNEKNDISKKDNFEWVCKLTEQETEKELQKKLLKMGGTKANITRLRDYGTEWLADGEMQIGANAILEGGKDALPEDSALKFYLKHKDEGMKICTGFVFTRSEYNIDGEWNYHAWCEDKEGNIHDCSNYRKIMYYGISLDEEQTEQFRRSVDFEYDAKCAREEKENGGYKVLYLGKDAEWKAQKDSFLKKRMRELLHRIEKGKGEKDGKSNDYA